MWSRRRLATVVAVAAVTVTAAVVAIVSSRPDRPDPDGPRVVQPGAPGESGRTLSPEELASLTVPPHNAADKEFFGRMIPHHFQALEMTALVTDRTSNSDVQLLAERIEVSQQDEIARMQTWLTQRGLEVPQPHAGHDTSMPGMLTDEQLAQLAQARDAEFDRHFLEFMILHHQGAITMANELYARGGGLEPESDRFAREVIADQSIEISRMQSLLTGLS